MKIDARNINDLWATLLVEELVRCGVTYIGIAPGSRSSPLAVAAGTHPRVRSLVHFDERGLAYHVLGWTRATGRPGAVITTSGTAVANLAPAVAEASYDRIPLLLLTADRPPELRETGANQTMDQVKLFGDLVRWQFDLPCPDDRVPARLVLTTIDQAVHRASRLPSGPVHLNCMFREPLAPVAQPFDRVRACAGLDAWARSRRPFTTYASIGPRVSRDETAEALAGLRMSRRGVVVAGALSPDDAAAAVRLAESIGWPLLPDVRSGLRIGRSSRAVIPHAELLLAVNAFAKRHACDAVLHLGGRIVSRRLVEFATAASVRSYVHVAAFPDRQDPAHRVTHRVEGDVAAFCQAASTLWPHRRPAARWLASWRSATRRAAGALKEYRQAARRLDEPLIAMELARLVPADQAIFLGNSLPIRLFEAFAGERRDPVRVAANRGVSGIDGVLATATGFAAGTGRPVTLLVGDLSLLHDLNSLALLRKQAVNVVVINNDGGGIFSFLPVASTTPEFERLFGTPHGFRFADAARMFGIPYSAPDTPAAFRSCFAAASTSGRAAVIEVRTDRARTVRAYRRLQQLVARRVTGRRA